LEYKADLYSKNKSKTQLENNFSFFGRELSPEDYARGREKLSLLLDQSADYEDKDGKSLVHYLHRAGLNFARHPEFFKDLGKFRNQYQLAIFLGLDVYT